MRFTTPLFDAWRRAHYAAEAVYELPYSIAEGFARKHRIPRERFLEGIAPRMTARERYRLQGAATRAHVDLAVDLAAVDPTRLALYAWSLARTERETRAAELDDAMTRAIARIRTRSPLALGRVSAVLDDSHSARGTREKHLRPLAVTVGVDALLRASASHYRAHWLSGD